MARFTIQNGNMAHIIWAISTLLHRVEFIIDNLSIGIHMISYATYHIQNIQSRGLSLSHPFLQYLAHDRNVSLMQPLQTSEIALKSLKTNKIEFGIDDNPTNDQVSAAIDRIQYKKGGKTFTGRALEVAKGLFKHEEGRKEVMILLTGES